MNGRRRGGENRRFAAPAAAHGKAGVPAAPDKKSIRAEEHFR